MMDIFFHNFNTYRNAIILFGKISRKKIALDIEHSAYEITVGSIESPDNRYFTLAYLRHICGSANTALCHRRVIFGSAAAWPRKSSKEPVRHCTSLAGVIVSDCTLISTLHSALPLLVHLSSISGLRKWDIHVLVGVKLLTYPVYEGAFQSSPRGR